MWYSWLSLSVVFARRAVSGWDLAATAHRSPSFAFCSSAPCPTASQIFAMLSSQFSPFRIVHVSQRVHTRRQAHGTTVNRHKISVGVLLEPSGSQRKHPVHGKAVHWLALTVNSSLPCRLALIKCVVAKSPGMFTVGCDLRAESRTHQVVQPCSRRGDGEILL